MRSFRWHWQVFKLRVNRFFKTSLPMMLGRPIKHHAYCISDCGFETPTRYFLDRTRKECKAHANENGDRCSMCRIIYHDRPGYEYVLSDSLEEATR